MNPKKLCLQVAGVIKWSGPGIKNLERFRIESKLTKAFFRPSLRGRLIDMGQGT